MTIASTCRYLPGALPTFAVSWPFSIVAALFCLLLPIMLLHSVDPAAVFDFVADVVERYADPMFKLPR